MPKSQCSAPENRTWLRPLALAGLLLAIVAARVLRFGAIFLRHDEFWSIWQGYGKFFDVLRWTPFDWPPLYYLVLDGWVGLVGIHAFSLRYLSVLMFLVGVASLYQILRRNAGHVAAWIGSLYYGGIAFLIFLSTGLRGYSLMLMVVPMAWFFAQRLLDRPNIKNVLGFSLAATACLYTTYVTVFPLALLAFYVLWQMRRMPGRHRKYVLLAGLFTVIPCLPIPFYYWPAQLRRNPSTFTIEISSLSAFPGAVSDLYRFWFRENTLMLVLLILLGIVGLAVRRRISDFSIFTFIWAFLVLPLFYFVHPTFGLFKPTYTSWILIGIAAFAGASLGQLPRWGRILALGLTMFLLVQLTPWRQYYRDFSSYLEVSLDWLRGHWRAGDIILLAEDQRCTSSVEIWNYMLRANFPDGLTFADNPVGHSRVWFVTASGSPNSAHWETLRRDYVERYFVGPLRCLFRLYEGPPDREGILFANGLRFHGAQFLQEGVPSPPGYFPQLHEGENVKVRFWWTVDEPLPLDYSVGTFLFDETGYVIDELHGPPDPTYPSDAPWETSRWQSGQIYYEDRKFEVPYPLPRQELQLRLAVYYWEEPAKRFAAPGTDALEMLPVMQMYVFSW